MVPGQDCLTVLPQEGGEGEACPDFEDFARDQRDDLLKYFKAHLPAEADAQDASQESLLRLLRYRSEPASVWRPLLFRIATNVVGEFYRRGESHHVRQHVPLEAVPLFSEAVENEERMERSQRKALLRAAILSLAPRARQIYLLSRVDELTYPQIAQRCGISVKAVEKSISRTIAALAERVGGGGDRAS